jgi:hypothetical protein
VTAEEWAEITLRLLRQCWIYGTQTDRRELLCIKKRIEEELQSDQETKGDR